MDFDVARPIYQQIIDDYKKRMIRGELRQGDKIPSQREYAEMARINPNTVQRAYREMENLNLVQTSRGQGTFVSVNHEELEAIKKDMAAAVLRSFVTEMRAMQFGDKEMLEMLGQALTSHEGGTEK